MFYITFHVTQNTEFISDKTNEYVLLTRATAPNLNNSYSGIIGVKGVISPLGGLSRSPATQNREESVKRTIGL